MLSFQAKGQDCNVCGVRLHLSGHSGVGGARESEVLSSKY